jgi:hypothetical protein
MHISLRYMPGATYLKEIGSTAGALKTNGLHDIALRYVGSPNIS